MLNNKLIQNLQVLTKKEMTRFMAFVESPYFNKHQSVRKLVAYLHKIYPNFKAKNCHRETIFRQVFPGEAHNQKQLALVFTYAQRLLGQFFAVEQFMEHPHQQNLMQLLALRQHQLDEPYNKLLKQSEKQLDDIEFKDERFYDLKFRLAAEADQYHQYSSKRQKDHSIELKQSNLDRLFIVEKLRDACEMLERNRILKIQLQPRLIDEVLGEISNHHSDYKEDPPIMVYYSIYQMLKERKHDAYEAALVVWLLHLNSFAPPEQRHVFNYFQNFCIAMINKGQSEYLKEVFKLYQLQLEGELLIEEGHLSEWHYKNMVTTGIRLGEMDWVINFIESYRLRLHPESRENAYRFNLASYFYATQQYGKVLDLLTQVEYNDLRYNLGAKALLLRTYYDLEEYDALHSLTESFRQYLQRNELMADSRRAGYYNLFKLTRRALAIRISAAFSGTEKLKKELLKLEHEIENAGQIFNKSWLVEKVTELKDTVSI